MISKAHAYLQRLDDERGQTLVEYALILVLASTVAILLLSEIGAVPADIFSKLDDVFQASF